ncbi:MAG: UDPGP type 1 family protein [Lachnospiraceae bacterium]|nr:UDPGP type 1 family protein [Lachnospiraceae bacterium]
MTYENALKKLVSCGQEHLLAFYDELSDDSKAALLEQIDGTDFSIVDAFSCEEANAARGEISPLSALTVEEISEKEEEFRKAGLQAIQDGKVCAVLMAGGMGTRLGTAGPKGAYDIGITKPVYIFQRLVENLLDVARESGTWIRLFVMTSEFNDEPTRWFFEEHSYFGYRPDKVVFFKQDMAPTVGFDGKVLLERKDRISTSPNGNGGWFSSMIRAGLGSILEEEGIEWLNVFNVDNVLQRICNPEFVGATILSGCEAGAKVIRKAGPDEKVGVICKEDGRTAVVEYTEMTDEMRNAVDDSGEYLYNFGVISNYLFSFKGLMRGLDQQLPIHIARKKIACIDAEGKEVKAEEPNGCKFELFIFDLLRALEGCLPYEVVRECEFAPIKNKTGVDSLETARELCKKNGIEL